MTDKQIEEMVLDIVGEVDYDILKLDYIEDTAECSSKEVRDNIAALVRIVKRHLYRY